MNLLEILKFNQRSSGRFITQNAWPILVCVAGWIAIATRLDKAIGFDPEYVYLPAARAFLEQGLSFFLTPESYRVVPFAYLWPALWGADPQTIRIANAGLWAGCVYFLWHTCCKLGSRRAGIIAVLLLAAQPEIYRYFSTEMTEPIFLFGLLGWMYTVAKIIITGHSGIRIAIQSGFFLTLTLLSRPVLQFITPLALMIFLAWLLYERWVRRNTTPTALQALIITLAWSLLIAMILPIVWAIKNGLLFGLWGLGTGAGTGLYLGTHPLFLGTEPGFLGFVYDVNGLTTIAAGTGDHLSLSGDRAARAAAIWQIQSMSPNEFATFFARKLWWWLMDQPLGGQNLRKFRIFEWLFIISGGLALIRFKYQRVLLISKDPSESSFSSDLLATKRLVFAGFLAAFLILMVIQLLPVLYNSRYNSALLEPWLIPLTSFSIALLSAPIVPHGRFHKNFWRLSLLHRENKFIGPALLALVIPAAMTPLVYNSIRTWDHIQIDPNSIGSMASRFKINSANRTRTEGIQARSEGLWVTTATPSVLLIDIGQDELDIISKTDPFNAIWRTKIALAPSKKNRCKYIETAYQTTEGEILQPHDNSPLRFSVHSDGNDEFVVTHANGLLRPTTQGSLRLILHCPIGTRVLWKETEFLESRQPWAAASRDSS